MRIRIERSFEKDVDAIRSLSILKRLRNLIALIENAESINAVPHHRKIEGYTSYYRIKLGDYRVGLDVSRGEVTFVRFLHRKDIYRFFPKKG